MQRNHKSTLPELTHLEENTADLWLSQGVIWIDETGSKNTYYLDQFGNRFYCKNYPRD